MIPELAKNNWTDKHQLKLAVNALNNTAANLYLRNGWVDTHDKHQGVLGVQHILKYAFMTELINEDILNINFVL